MAHLHQAAQPGLINLASCPLPSCGHVEASYAISQTRRPDSGAADYMSVPVDRRLLGRL